MLKKLYLSAALITVSFALSAANTDRITTIQNSLAHIAQETKGIMLELKAALTLADRAEKHFQDQLQEDYSSARAKCVGLLTTISTSKEFTSTIEQVTDAQVEFIVTENMQYEQFSIDSTGFPLQQKVDRELAIAAFDEPTAQLFNVFFIALAVITGSKTLLHKLEVRKNELEIELSTLQSQTNQ